MVDVVSWDVIEDMTGREEVAGGGSQGGKTETRGRPEGSKWKPEALRVEGNKTKGRTRP